MSLVLVSVAGQGMFRARKRGPYWKIFENNIKMFFLLKAKEEIQGLCFKVNFDSFSRGWQLTRSRCRSRICRSGRGRRCSSRHSCGGGLGRAGRAVQPPVLTGNCCPEQNDLLAVRSEHLGLVDLLLIEAVPARLRAGRAQTIVAVRGLRGTRAAGRTRGRAGNIPSRSLKL